MRFSPFIGPFLFHCHLIPHECLGMMANIVVVNANSTSAPPTAGQLGLLRPRP
jgi:hypothetical protein